MPFYDDMAQVARDLLAPDTAGGLGQGAITLVRTTPGTPDPSQPWVPVTPGWATSSRDPSRMTKREKADVVEREFFEPGETAGASGANIDAMIEGLIGPFLCGEYGGLPLHITI